MSAAPGCPAPVIIRTYHLALFDLLQDCRPAGSPGDHQRDAAELVVSDVIELQDDNVILAAVHTRMLLQVAGDKRPQLGAPGRVAVGVLLRISLVQIAVPSALG